MRLQVIFDMLLWIFCYGDCFKICMDSEDDSSPSIFTKCGKDIFKIYGSVNGLRCLQFYFEKTSIKVDLEMQHLSRRTSESDIKLILQDEFGTSRIKQTLGKWRTWKRHISDRGSRRNTLKTTNVGQQNLINKLYKTRHENNRKIKRDVANVYPMILSEETEDSQTPPMVFLEDNILKDKVKGSTEISMEKLFPGVFGPADTTTNSNTQTETGTDSSTETGTETSTDLFSVTGSFTETSTLLSSVTPTAEQFSTQISTVATTVPFASETSTEITTASFSETHRSPETSTESSTATFSNTATPTKILTKKMFTTQTSIDTATQLILQRSTKQHALLFTGTVSATDSPTKIQAELFPNAGISRQTPTEGPLSTNKLLPVTVRPIKSFGEILGNLFEDTASPTKTMQTEIPIKNTFLNLNELLQFFTGPATLAHTEVSDFKGIGKDSAEILISNLFPEIDKPTETPTQVPPEKLYTNMDLGSPEIWTNKPFRSTRRPVKTFAEILGDVFQGTDSPTKAVQTEIPKKKPLLHMSDLLIPSTGFGNLTHTAVPPFKGIVKGSAETSKPFPETVLPTYFFPTKTTRERWSNIPIKEIPTVFQDTFRPTETPAKILTKIPTETPTAIRTRKRFPYIYRPVEPSINEEIPTEKPLRNIYDPTEMPNNAVSLESDDDRLKQPKVAFPTYATEWIRETLTGKLATDDLTKSSFFLLSSVATNPGSTELYTKLMKGSGITSRMTTELFSSSDKSSGTLTELFLDTNGSTGMSTDTSSALYTDATSDAEVPIEKLFPESTETDFFSSTDSSTETLSETSTEFSSTYNSMKISTEENAAQATTKLSIEKLFGADDSFWTTESFSEKPTDELLDTSSSTEMSAEGSTAAKISIDGLFEDDKSSWTITHPSETSSDEMTHTRIEEASTSWTTETSSGVPNYDISELVTEETSTVTNLMATSNRGPPRFSSSSTSRPIITLEMKTPETQSTSGRSESTVHLSRAFVMDDKTTQLLKRPLLPLTLTHFSRGKALSMQKRPQAEPLPLQKRPKAEPLPKSDTSKKYHMTSLSSEITTCWTVTPSSTVVALRPTLRAVTEILPSTTSGHLNYSCLNTVIVSILMQFVLQTC